MKAGVSVVSKAEMWVVSMAELTGAMGMQKVDRKVV